MAHHEYTAEKYQWIVVQSKNHGWGNPALVLLCNDHLIQQDEFLDLLADCEDKKIKSIFNKVKLKDRRWGRIGSTQKQRMLLSEALLSKFNYDFDEIYRRAYNLELKEVIKTCQY